MTRQGFAWIEEDVERKTREREQEEFQGIEPAIREQKAPPQSSEAAARPIVATTLLLFREPRP
jgi:hypothetical protein